MTSLRQQIVSHWIIVGRERLGGVGAAGPVYGGSVPLPFGGDILILGAFLGVSIFLASYWLANAGY